MTGPTVFGFLGINGMNIACALGRFERPEVGVQVGFDPISAVEDDAEIPRS
jgi:hypothetical protein